MPVITDTIKLDSPFLDKRVKLLPCQKENLTRLHGRGCSIHSLSRMYKISRRSIQFILYPDRLEKNKETRPKSYYRGPDYIKAHRKRKIQILSPFLNPALLNIRIH